MEESTGMPCTSAGVDPPPEELKTEDSKTDSEVPVPNGVICDKNESGVVIETSECKTDIAEPKAVTENNSCEVNEDARSVGDLDSLPAGDELVLNAAGSDSGVEGCGRALSSGGGSRSCASSVVSCGSGCGSESSSVAGAPPRPRRRLNVTLTEPQKKTAPLGSSTPRPVTAPRGPNLATRERARSREKPVLPEKPRPLTPKPRIRPTADLPNLVRESPALRAKPTKTSTARCRTPNSPSEDKRWQVNGPRLSSVTDVSATRVAADKYGTLPRRRRDAEADGSPKHDVTPPASRRPTITRSTSSRSATKTRVRIYAEKVCQTVLLGSDVESALAGIIPNIENRVEVSRCHRGVQASGRDSVAAAEAAAAEERALRRRAEQQLATERAARLAALSDLERNSLRLIELAGAAGAGAGADGCLAALEEQLRAAAQTSAAQRATIEELRDRCEALQAEAISARESASLLEGRLREAESEAAEMQDFLTAETGALSDSLREAEGELAKANQELDKRRAECRQLVRMCEQRRQEALAAAARARGGGAGAALDALAGRVRALTAAVLRAYRLPRARLDPAHYHNDLYSRSDSGSAQSPAEEGARGGPLLAAVARALHEDEVSRASDDNDSADLLDSETEPCLVTDPEYAEEWWSGAEGAAWSGEELSPVCDEPDDSVSERESLRNLSAAIALRQRSEAEDERGPLVDRIVAIDNRLAELLRALKMAASSAAQADDADSLRLANALRDKIDITEKNVADVVVKKLAEIDASKNMMEQYRQSVEMLKNQLLQPDEEENFELLEQEVRTCSETERRERYAALDLALSALGGSGAASWPRLAGVRARLERLAFALASAPPAVPTA